MYLKMVNLICFCLLELEFWAQKDILVIKKNPLKKDCYGKKASKNLISLSNFIGNQQIV